MARKPQQNTPTMARIYARQGYLRKAAQIYRSLLEIEPTRTDWKAALAELEDRIVKQPVPSRKELGLMINDWIGMMKAKK